MQSRIRREALRAVAKLALGAMPAVTLASCGGKMDLAHEGADPTARESPIAEPPAASEPDAACALPGAVTLTRSFEHATTFTKAELDCCVAGLEGPAGRKLVGSASANCCNAVIAAVDTGMLAFSDVTSEVRSLCCFSGNDEKQQALWEHSFCTPWGPPVPPAMDWSVEGVA